MTVDPLVYVVSLGADSEPPWSTLSWRQMVHLRKVYFHPPGKRQFPRDPVGYLGFRYEGHLQALAAIEQVVTVPCRSELSRFVPEIDGEACRLAYDQGARVPHFVYILKDVVTPHHIIPAGPKIHRARKVWAFLSLLQQCETISEAETLTRERLEKG